MPYIARRPGTNMYGSAPALSTRSRLRRSYIQSIPDVHEVHCWKEKPENDKTQSSVAANVQLQLTPQTTEMLPEPEPEKEQVSKPVSEKFNCASQENGEEEQFRLKTEKRENELRLEREKLEELKMEHQKIEQYRIQIQKLEHIKTEQENLKEEVDIRKLQAEQEIYVKTEPNTQELEIYEIHDERNSTCTHIIADTKYSDNNENVNEAQNSSQFPIYKEMQPLMQNIPRPFNCTATTKALQHLGSTMGPRVWRRKKKVPMRFKRRIMNQKLNKMLIPKSGEIVLHELKPGCIFNASVQPGTNPPIYVVRVECNGTVLAVAQGITKLNAKNAAAENAIRTLVSDFLSKNSLMEGDLLNYDEKRAPHMGGPGGEFNWAGLASFAMYKMFADWQNQGVTFPSVPTELKKKPSACQPIKKELPAAADKMHPCHLINIMRPGAASFEIQRSLRDNVSFVTVAYEIDGNLYTGSASNKKEARKEAAKTALKALYGMKYPD